MPLYLSQILSIIYQHILYRIQSFMLRQSFLFIFCGIAAVIAHQKTQLCPVENCQICLFSQGCVSCASGFYMRINADNPVMECIKHKCEPQQCQKCDSNGKCSQCTSGFHLNEEGECISQKIGQYRQNSVSSHFRQNFRSDRDHTMLGCLEIGRHTQNFKCLKCQKNYQLIDGQCIRAKSELLTKLQTESLAAINCSVTNCAIDGCLTSRYCYKCAGDLVPNTQGTLCLTCNVPNCAICSTNNVCGSCNSGYQLVTSINTCVTCNIPNCLVCSSNNACGTCMHGFSLSSSKTDCNNPCAYPCATCNANGSCATCQLPFNSQPFANNTCFMCRTPNCQKCNISDPSVCTTCMAMYTVNATDNTCILKCNSPYCTSCASSTTACLTCIQSYTPVNGLCTPCTQAPKCLSCPNSVNFCTQCAKGYYNSSDGICIPCSIQGCASCPNSGKCQQFQTATNLISFQDSGSLIRPTYCVSGCAQCSSAYPSSCYQCLQGFYLNNNLCFPCASGCQNCVPGSPTSCLSCYSNMFLNITDSQLQSGSCVACNSSSNCLTCLGMQNLSMCTSCPTGYAMAQNTTCTIKCPNFCTNCFNSSTNTIIGPTNYNVTCSACEEGYGLTWYGRCLPCQANCKFCSGDNPNVCFSCSDGFYINETNMACLPCSNSCIACSPQGCLVCYQGFYLSQESTCKQSCQYPCATCSTNSTNCTSCVYGFDFVQQGSSDGYIGNCTASNQNCSSTSTCLLCPSGFYMENAQCIRCTATNCWQCNPQNPNRCTSCLPGFYLQSNTCYRCPANCTTCSLNGTCLSCQQGYLLGENPVQTNNKAQCKACNPPCKQCRITPNICTQCADGFVLVGWGCVSYFHYQFNISFNNGVNVFDQNYQYFLNQTLSALQTLNFKAISITDIIANSSTNTTVVTQLSTLQKSDTSASYAEYQNLDYVLMNNGGTFANMTVKTQSVGVAGGIVPIFNDNTATIVGIVIPVGALIILFIGYCICAYQDNGYARAQESSRNNMEMRQL